MRHRLSFTRFLELGIEDGIPDCTTLWLFREKLAKAGLIDKLFECFGQHLEAKGYIARGGQMVDTTIVRPMPKEAVDAFLAINRQRQFFVTPARTE